jgi:glycosyltransferase involved in cell wall biosynthesis
MAPALIERGVDLHLALLTDRQGLVPEVQRCGVVVHDLSTEHSLLGRARRLRQLCDSVRPDVLHATLWDAVVPCQLVARRARVPLVVTWASVGYSAQFASGARRKFTAVLWIDRLLARLSGCWFQAVTPGVADANGSLLQVPTDRIRVVGRGRPDVSPPTPNLEELRSDLALDPGSIVLVSVGRHEPVKDHVTLIRSCAIASEYQPGIRLLVAGRDGASTSAVRAEIVELGLERVVTLLGQRNDVEDLLSLADIFVSSSRSEGAAGGVIEAMRAGLPIVSTEVVGQRGILVDGENCLLAPVGDAEALARCILRMVGDEGLRSTLGRAGRVTFDERFTLSAAAERTVEMYREVAASSRNDSEST